MHPSASGLSCETRTSTGPPAIAPRAKSASEGISSGHQSTPSVRKWRSTEAAPPKDRKLVPSIVNRCPRIRTRTRSVSCRGVGHPLEVGPLQALAPARLATASRWIRTGPQTSDQRTSLRVRHRPDGHPEPHLRPDRIPGEASDAGRSRLRRPAQGQPAHPGFCPPRRQGPCGQACGRTHALTSPTSHGACQSWRIMYV